MKPDEGCCPAAQKAWEQGTDCEGNMSFFYVPRGFYGDALSEDIEVGCDLPPIKFCPWCGKKVNDDDKTN